MKTKRQSSWSNDIGKTLTQMNNKFTMVRSLVSRRRSCYHSTDETMLRRSSKDMKTKIIRRHLYDKRTRHIEYLRRWRENFKEIVHVEDEWMI